MDDGLTWNDRNETVEDGGHRSGDCQGDPLCPHCRRERQEPWQVVRLVRQPSGFGVATLTVRHPDKGSVVIPMMREELRALAMQALAAMEPD